MLQRSINRESSTFRYLDWTTIILYLILVVAGVFSVYAASYDFDHASIFSFDEFSGKQIRWIGLALALGFMVLLIDERMYETYAYPIYVVMLIVLVITIFVAPDIKGSRSWLVFGPMSMQPAEFGKFATALALAKLFSGYKFELRASRGNYLKALTIIVLPILLILAQKETGSALAYTALFLVLYREGMSGLILLAALAAVVIFVVAVKFAGTAFLDGTLGEAIVFGLIELTIVLMLLMYCRRPVEGRNVLLWFLVTGLIAIAGNILGWPILAVIYFLVVIAVACVYCLVTSLHIDGRKMFVTVGAAIGAVIFLFSVDYAFNSVLQPHQQKRIKVTLGLEEDLLDAGYNVNQSKIAIGSGGFAGKGFLNGTQTKLKYVPEQHTDFIFCTIGEEEGFLGSVGVLALFLALILRTIHIAERQPTTFGRVYAYCVASYFLFHLAINIGMVIGLCPVIGIPLPFFSYGGSSLWSFTFLLFIMLRIDAARREHH